MPMYPSAPIIDTTMKFKTDTIQALTSFKQNYPYKVGYEKRKEGLHALNEQLNAIYQERVELEFASPEIKDSFNSNYNCDTGVITMVGKLSIITFLHEYAHALGKNEFGAVKWSLSLFAKVYPKAIEKLNPMDHCMVAQ